MVSRYESFFTVAAILAAATVGDGVFALPYIFYASGWFLGLTYLALLAVIVIIAHTVYLRVLEGEDEKERLLGLAKKYFGKLGFGIGFFAIVAGLLLALVAILVLGARFLTLLFPAASGFLALTIFWALVSIPSLLRDGRVVGLELVGIICTSTIIIFVFSVAWPHVGFGGAPVAVPANAFLPFGVILFALAGWTGIEPAYETRKKWNMKSSSVAALAAGTIFAAALYALFVMGILGSGVTVAPDTLSGLADWPGWERVALGVLGFLAVWTVSMPISKEIKNSLEGDLKWNPFVAKLLIVCVPLFLVLSGFNNFLLVVSLSGGLFISLQYLLMIAVGRRALALTRPRKFLMDILALIFILAAVYEIYYFIVR